MQASLTYLQEAGHGPAALRITTPPSEDRTPTHFIALIDISESMADGSKLTQVKHCMSLLLKFLGQEDRFSLITFGEESRIVLEYASIASTAEAAQVAVQGLRVDGCTNLSAGLASVHQVLAAAAAAPARPATATPAMVALKPALFLLTDGHANRGVTGTDPLRAIITTMMDANPSLSFSFVAYGMDHNATLLKSLAELCSGSYSIVRDIEGAALAMGEALGNVISCVAQNVSVNCPPGTKVLGPHTVTPEGILRIGDLFAGSESVYLLDVPAQTESGPAAVFRLNGVQMPSLQSMDILVQAALDTARNADIELTRLRYRCGDMFRQIRESNREALSELEDKVTALERELEDSFFDGNVLRDMLRGELTSMRQAIEAIRHTGVTRFMNTQLLQHEAYTHLGRGATEPIAPQLSPPGAPRWRADSDENPVPPLCPMTSAAVLSPMAPQVARRVANTLRAAASMAPAEQ